ncbi:MAG: hypothetical protein WDM77_09970 [Steroidobacteraceae bacterium]
MGIEHQAQRLDADRGGLQSRARCSWQWRGDCRCRLCPVVGEPVSRHECLEVVDLAAAHLCNEFARWQNNGKNVFVLLAKPMDAPGVARIHQAEYERNAFGRSA